MGQQDKFLQVPVYILALPGGDTERLRCILHCGVVHYAEHAVTRIGQVGRHTEHERFLEHRLCRINEDDLPTGVLPEGATDEDGNRVPYLDVDPDDWIASTDDWQQFADPEDARIAVAIKDLGFRKGNLAQIRADCARVDEHVASMETTFGPSPTVRIRVDIVSSALQGQWSYRQFAFLVGIYSCIGKVRMKGVWLTRELIQARALGYKRPADIPEGTSLYTERQIRNTLDWLEGHGFFARCHTSQRVTKFAIGCTSDQLRKQEDAMRKHSAQSVVKARAAADAALLQKRRDEKMSDEFTEKVAKIVRKGKGKRPASIPTVAAVAKNLFADPSLANETQEQKIKRELAILQAGERKA